MRRRLVSLPGTFIIPALIALALANSVRGASDARENWGKHCTDCHGEDGRSKTRLGRKSGAPDLTDKKVQAKLTDDEAFKAIKFGRKNDKGEEKMDAFANGLSDGEITALVAYVRSLAK